jgi:hypothetical protein
MVEASVVGIPVREAVIGLQRPVPHQLGRQRAGVDVGHNLVIIAVHDQDRHRDLLQVLGEVGLGERDDPVVMGLRAAHHALPPPVLDDRLRRRGGRAVEPVERARRQIAVEVRPVGRDLDLEAVEDARATRLSPCRAR